MMMNMIRISAAVILIVGAGLVHGAWTNRWGPSPALAALARGSNPSPWSSATGRRRLPS